MFHFVCVGEYVCVMRLDCTSSVTCSCPLYWTFEMAFDHVMCQRCSKCCQLNNQQGNSIAFQNGFTVPALSERKMLPKCTGNSNIE